MSNFEKVRELVNAYVAENGDTTEMTRSEFLAWVNKTYSNISADKNNLYPTDISFNLYNAALTNFPGPNLCLVYIPENKTFRLVGSDYKHTGNIYQYMGRSNERVVGRWVNGECQMLASVTEDNAIPEDILDRRDDLVDGLKIALKTIPVQVNTRDENVLVLSQEQLICGITVEEEVFRIYNASDDWAKKTAYRCEESNDGTWHYYVESIDEAIGEVKRLVLFEAMNSNAAANKNEISFIPSSNPSLDNALRKTLNYLGSRYKVECLRDLYQIKKRVDRLFYVYSGNRKIMWVYFYLGKNKSYISIETWPEYVEAMHGEYPGFIVNPLREQEPQIKLIFTDFDKIQKTLAKICDCADLVTGKTK